MHSKFNQYREKVWQNQFASESEVVNSLLTELRFDKNARRHIQYEAFKIAYRVRQQKPSGTMSPFLVEYGLTTDEGIALMCLAEALLRVPDAETVDTLISDKLTAADWGRHLGHSSSPMVNASTWALMLTGKILTRDDSQDIAKLMRQVLQRLGEPVVRLAVAKAIRLIADQFILGSDIESSELRGRDFVDRGYRYSYDMLGESALTWDDARRYKDSYANAIRYMAKHCRSDKVNENPGISVKLSAIHPRYQSTQRETSFNEIVTSTKDLARLAKKSNMGFNIDAEEANRLDLSLDVIESLLSDASLDQWDGIGVVVQAYGQRALPVIELVYEMARKAHRKVMLRLVKGAYWDTEIKHAQVLGLSNYPVFTRKSSTDLSFLVCAQRLFEMNDWIFPQFATHNIHTICSVMEMAAKSSDFEFQRLHGMGEETHEIARDKFGYQCRIYAPVGAHEDLLAYLVRRILENGANSSFVNQLMDERVPLENIITDPITQTENHIREINNPAVRQPLWIFGDSRRNSKGLDLECDSEVFQLRKEMAEYADRSWTGRPSGDNNGNLSHVETRISPVDRAFEVGSIAHSNPDSIEQLISTVASEFNAWSQTSAEERAAILRRVADEYEKNQAELIALMVRETGKSIADAVAEVREAVDFCRYYANEAVRLNQMPYQSQARGIVVCISPWNFPLAIFTGQIAGELAAGNSVIAKPAEQSPLIAARAIDLMRQAGVPEMALATVFGLGETVGEPLVSDPRIAGVSFTGSHEVAQTIHRSIANKGNSLGKLTAETGGLNAMIIDSTALPEQAVRDIVVSAFQSAGQRCSALRMLYVQEEMKTRVCDMLFGAMDVLVVGDPWEVKTDVGPVIDADAKQKIDQYIERMTAKGLLRHRTPIHDPLNGYFVAPTVFEVTGIEQLEEEIFGPVLHFASYRSQDLPAVIESINRSGYGLTFGLHTRIDRRVQQVSDSIDVGNVYVNRNQIGAVVGCQPFGGRGLSGTGPKAGGPYYVPNHREFGNDSGIVSSNGSYSRGDLSKEMGRLCKMKKFGWIESQEREVILRKTVQEQPRLLEILENTIEFIQSPVDLDGPTGESNRLYIQGKGVFVCIGSESHVIQALACENAVLAVGIESKVVNALIAAKAPVIASDKIPDSNSLARCELLAGITFEHLDLKLAGKLRRELAGLDGPIVQLITDFWAPWQFIAEKTLCIDTTAAGGNARLLIDSGS